MLFVEMHLALLHIFVEFGPALLAVIQPLAFIVRAGQEPYVFACQLARRPRPAAPD